MNGSDDLQRLVGQVTGEAQDEPGRFRSFLAALQAVLRLPADAHVIGEPVELLGLDYSGHSRQGLMARCRREGREYVVELVVLVLKESAARCRLIGSDRQITLRSTRLWELVPGDIVTVQPRKRWTHARHPYMSGEVLGWRFAPQEIGLVPLRLEPRASLDPGPEAGVGVEPSLRHLSPAFPMSPRAGRTPR